MEYSKPAKWVKNLKVSLINEYLKLCANSEIISFGLGLPDLSIFPKEDFWASIQEQLLNPKRTLQYHYPEDSLKEEIVKLMLHRGIVCHVDEIFLTSGAQQAISLVLRMLFESQRIVLVEELVYPVFIQALIPYEPHLIVIPTDLVSGICIDHLRDTLKKTKHPALLYLSSEGANPHGVSLSPEKRIALANLCDEFDLFILEDDAYGFLNYQQLCPPIKKHCSQSVFYIGSFSKILAPSLRVGWLVAPPQYVKILSTIKEFYDINTMTFSQHVLCDYLKKNKMAKHIEKLKKYYAMKCDYMLDCLQEKMPEEIEIFKPQSGFFMWAQTKKYNTDLLLKYAIQEKVCFIPGQFFNFNHCAWAKYGLRLCFTYPNFADIEIGVKRLAKAIQKFHLNDSGSD